MVPPSMNTALPKAFDDLIRNSDTPVLVDFWADWCAPCRALAPVVQQIAREYQGRLLTVKVNVDQKPEIAQRLGIQSIPTLMLFYRGHQLMRISGARNYEELKAAIELHWPYVN